MKQEMPSVDGYYWLYRTPFDAPEIAYVFVSSEPIGYAQTRFGLIKLETDDWFAVVDPPTTPETKEVA